MENNKTIKLTGLTDEQVDFLIKAITDPFDENTDYHVLVNQIGVILLSREEVSIHYDTINNKDHIIRF